MREPPVMALLLLAAACHPAGMAVPVERLVGPDQVDLSAVVSGVSTLRSFQIQNAGTAVATVKLSVAEPFFLPTALVTVPAGGSATVRVGIQAPGYETLRSHIEAVSAHSQVSIPLTAAFDLDVDNDGYITTAAGGSDCNDRNAAVNPGAVEVCDGIDNDCNGLIDDNAVDITPWYRDADRDTWGSSTDFLVQCDQPVGYVSRRGDCNDDDPTIHPGAAEIWYDGIDENCDGKSDFDQDGDGYDDSHYGGTDCRDTDPDVHPGAPEVDNGLDDDCDGMIDETFVHRGDLVFTEIMLHPSTGTAGQFVELWNANTSRTIDLTDYTVSSSGGSELLPAIRLAPGGVAVLCGSMDGAHNGWLTCAATLPAMLQDADHVDLASESTLDEVDWTGWTIPSGASLELGVLDPDSNDVEANWCQATSAWNGGDLGSPGIVAASPCGTP